MLSRHWNKSGRSTYYSWTKQICRQAKNWWTRQKAAILWHHHGNQKKKLLSHAPQGYQVMDIPRDGHCLFLACIEAMVHSRLTIPSKWLSKPRHEQHREMRKALLNTCVNEFHTDPKYANLKAGLLAESKINKGQNLFQDMCDRIKGGAYGRYSELASPANTT